RPWRKAHRTSRALRARGRLQKDDALDAQRAQSGAAYLSEGGIQADPERKAQELGPARGQRVLGFGFELDARPAGLRPPQMLVKPRHDLDEIARPETIIELMHQNLVPGVLAGAGRARQTENISR